uniref:RING-type domain-containing protein n=2 Tax=Macrostomum lignano TaxID=282301 RepID=A0A1I8IGW9_9PLAT
CCANPLDSHRLIRTCIGDSMQASALSGRMHLLQSSSCSSWAGREGIHIWDRSSRAGICLDSGFRSLHSLMSRQRGSFSEMRTCVSGGQMQVEHSPKPEAMVPLVHRLIVAKASRGKEFDLQHRILVVNCHRLLVRIVREQLFDDEEHQLVAAQILIEDLHGDSLFHRQCAVPFAKVIDFSREGLISTAYLNAAIAKNPLRQQVVGAQICFRIRVVNPVLLFIEFEHGAQLARTKLGHLPSVAVLASGRRRNIAPAALNEYLRCQNECLRCQNECLRCQNECLRCQNECLRCQNECLRCQNECLRCQNECLRCQNECLRCQNECLRCQNECLRCQNECLRCQNECLRCQNECLRCQNECLRCQKDRTGAAVPMKGRYPSQQSLLSSASTLQHSQQQQQQSVDPFRRHLRGRLKPAICRLFKRVHEQSRLSYTIADDAQEYLENYAIEKLATLFEPQAPSDIYEAEEKLGQVFASCSLDQEQINELRDQAMRKKKKNSTLYDSVHKSVRCDEIVCLFIVLVTEFVLCEILRVSLTYMIKIKVNDIKKVDIRIVVDTFFSNQASAPAESTWPQDYMATFPTEYRRAINELIYFEETFAQQLQIIGQLFKQPLVDLCPSSPDVDTIFSALSAITECTNFLYVALDDSRNITEHPPIGHCFYELSEEGHFDSYAKYAQDVLSVKCRDRLFELLGNSLVKEKFETVGREIELQAAGHLSYYSLLSSCPAPVPPPAAGAASKKNSDADGSSAQNHLNFYSHHHHHQVSDSVSAASSTATLTSLSTATTCASSSASPAGLEQGEELRAVMLLACRYLLPKLLLVPVYHFLYYDRILERFEQLQEKNMWHCRNGSSTARSASSGGAELESADDADAASQQQPSLCGSPVTSGYNADRRRSSSSLPVEVCSDDRDTIVQTRSILVSTSHRVKRTLDEFERRPVPAATVSAASIPGVGSNGDDSVSLSVSPTGGSDIEESASVVAAAAASGAASRMSNQQQRSVLLNPLASRLFFHASMSAPDSMHTDRACSKKLAQLRSMTRSAPELDLAKPRCTIFYKEGTLYQMERAGRFQERRVYLFNNRLFVMKASKTLPLRSINEEYRLKRVVFLLQHRFVLVDHPKPVTKPAAAGGTEEEMYTFSIEYLPSPDTVEGGATVGTAPIKQRITFATKSLLDKEEWMLILIYLQSYHMFEEYLSLKGLTDTAEAIHFPQDHRGYEYWQPDSDQVIELEENSESSSSESHVIRRATLNKLIERMTHYSGNIDSRLMKVFLMTFRSFCTPLHLLTKLISRFNFPEYTYVDFQTDDSMMSVAQAQLRKREFEHSLKATYVNSRHPISHCQDKYCRKVRLRVLKVMTTWIENYFHDFGKCPELVNGLRDFLNGPSVDKLYDIKKFQVPNLLKQLDRRSRGEGRRELVQSIEDYPEVLWHTARDKREFNIMTLHPLELARQITLYMFSLYMRIEPWELVTGDWMKTKEKQLRAPNVHNLIRYTNRLTWWCCLNVLKTNHLEERRCVLLRIYEIMKYFRSLNNFLGLAALDSVFVNSSIQYIRLQHTWKLIKNGKDNKFLEQVQELVSNGNTMRQYDELLRTLDTACVPNLRYHLSLIFRLLEINRSKATSSNSSSNLLPAGRP